MLSEHEFSVPLDHVDPGGERRLPVELSRASASVEVEPVVALVLRARLVDPVANRASIAAVISGHHARRRTRGGGGRRP